MIDWRRVADLRAEIGNEGFAEVVEIFLEEVEGVLLRLTTDPDSRRFEEDLHFVKGSAWNLGFRQLGALCQEGEKRASQGYFSHIDISAVVESYGASKKCFLIGLADPGSISTAA
jgi:histidine phosphotransfer protein HptB